MRLSIILLMTYTQLTLLTISLARATPANTELPFYPPFLDGKKFLVSQGFNGKKTHSNPLNQYAIDLVMPTGEPICATNEGIVHSMQNITNPWEKLMHDKSNFVRIKHPNGSISDYQHLLSGSIKVNVGQLLMQGECFAQAGSSGNTNGPHLHFSILTEINGQLVSKYFKFTHPNGGIYTPKYLEWVYN